MFERQTVQESLIGFEELVEPIKVVEIGCGIGSDGSPDDPQTGRMYHLPYVYHGVEREEEFVQRTRFLDEDARNKARSKAEESGIIFGNAADLPFADGSIDVVTMRSVFGQFTGRDLRELDNVRDLGLKEVFRVLRLGGIIAISEENTPWDNDKVFDYLNHAGFTVIEYQAMQRDWRVPDRRNWYGVSNGDYRNIYVPENEAWLKKLKQFYGDEDGLGMVAAPRQYVMIGQKQQPATIEKQREWEEWSVSEDTLHYSGSELTRKQKTYKYGKPVKQEYLPGMRSSSLYNQAQGELFWLPRKYFL